MVQNKRRGVGALVRRMAGFSKNAMDVHSHLGLDVFSDSPVDGDATPRRFDEFLSD